jgi:hypothetical protein
MSEIGKWVFKKCKKYVSYLDADIPKNIFFV